MLESLYVEQYLEITDYKEHLMKAHEGIFTTE